MKIVVKGGNFAYLLGGLLALIILVAIAKEQGRAGTLWLPFGEPALILLLLFGIWGLAKGRTLVLLAGAVLAAIGIALALIDYGWGVAELRRANMGIVLTFSVASTWIAIRSLVVSGSVDLNKIIGAICIYLLVGLDWTFLYLFANLALPGSFHGLSAGDLRAQFGDLLYYSYVTLTTVGYGDVTPVRPLARTLAFLEAIAGQFYVAVLVAWLVGLYLAGKSGNAHGPRAQ
ncbi:MAG: ion channel [Burkholderiales bacterium]|nr:ion channel [Burkholderiales bacterium]